MLECGYGVLASGHLPGGYYHGAGLDARRKVTRAEVAQENIGLEVTGKLIKYSDNVQP
jgi:hypothetical protein